MKTVQFIAEKIVKTACTDLEGQFQIYHMNSKQMQRVEVQEDNFQFDQYYYFKQRKLLIIPQKLEFVFLCNT